MSNLGPMTTPFSRPSSCTSSAGVTYTNHPNGGFYYFQGPPASSSRDCYPPNWQTVTGAYYSPAASCPVSYTPACTQTEVVGAVTETRVTCCPSVKSIKYSCQTDSADTRFPWAATLPCASAFPSPVSSVLFTPLVWANTTTRTYTDFTNTNAGAVNAFGVLIRYQTSDLTTSSSSRATVPAQGQTSESPSSVPQEPTPLPAPALSAGAAAGVGIGVGLAVIFLGLGAFFLWRRRRRDRALAGEKERGSDADAAAGGPGPDGHLLGGHYPNSPYQPSELSGGGGYGPSPQGHPAGGSFYAPVKAQSPYPASELPVTNTVHEMPADAWPRPTAQSPQELHAASPQQAQPLAR